MSRIPLWLDCDPGHDDAFAILLAAHHPRLELLGISTVYGNAPVTKTTENALSILQSIGVPDIHVFPGATKPFCREVVHAEDIHGESGLDGSDLLPQATRAPLAQCNAIREMRDALMACPPNTAWLVATGTLTNVALLIATFPEVAAHMKGLSIMGGAVGDGYTDVTMGSDFNDPSGKLCKRIGNTTPYAEFNIWCDPESAQSLLKNPALASKTTLVTLDLTHQAFVSQDIQERFLNANNTHETPTRMRRMFHELLLFFTRTYSNVFGLKGGPPLHDPLAVAVLLADLDQVDLGLAFHDNGGERWNVDVVLHGDELGRTLVSPATDSRGVTIPRSLNLQQLWNVLQECLTRADAATGYTR